jgi:hypothetical protein
MQKLLYRTLVSSILRILYLIFLIFNFSFETSERRLSLQGKGTEHPPASHGQRGTQTQQTGPTYQDRDLI